MAFEPIRGFDNLFKGIGHQTYDLPVNNNKDELDKAKFVVGHGGAGSNGPSVWGNGFATNSANTAATNLN